MALLVPGDVLRDALVIPFLSLSLSLSLTGDNYCHMQHTGVNQPIPTPYTLKIGQYNGRDYSNVATLTSYYGWLIENSNLLIIIRLVHCKESKYLRVVF
jgi:hypothetical protein